MTNNKSMQIPDRESRFIVLLSATDLKIAN